MFINAKYFKITKPLFTFALSFKRDVYNIKN